MDTPAVFHSFTTERHVIKISIIVVIGAIVGAVAGYMVGYERGVEITKTQYQPTVENPFDAETNPLENVETNPFEGVKVNPFE